MTEPNTNNSVERASDQRKALATQYRVTAACLSTVKANVTHHRLLAALLVRSAGESPDEVVSNIMATGRVNALLGEWEAELLNAAAQRGARAECVEGLEHVAAALNEALSTALLCLEESASLLELAGVPTAEASTLEVDIVTDDLQPANDVADASEPERQLVHEPTGAADTTVLERELEAARRELARTRHDLEVARVEHAAEIEALHREFAIDQKHLADLQSELEARGQASAAREVQIKAAHDRVQVLAARFRAAFSERMDVQAAINELARAGVPL